MSYVGFFSDSQTSLYRPGEGGGEKGVWALV